MLEAEILIDFADDWTVNAVAKLPDDMELYRAENIHAIKFWL